MDLPENILTNSNEKFESKKKELEKLEYLIQSTFSLSATNEIEELMQKYAQSFFKDISPALVQKMLDLMLLYLKKFQFKQILVESYVKYMIFNSTAKSKFKQQCLEIFKYLYQLVPSDLLLTLGLIVVSNQPYFAQIAIEIVLYILTLKQFGPIKIRFEDFNEFCLPNLLSTIAANSSSINLKKACLELLSQLIQEMGQESMLKHLDRMDKKQAMFIVSELEKKHNITISFKNQQSHNQIVSQSDDLPISKQTEQSTQTQNSSVEKQQKDPNQQLSPEKASQLLLALIKNPEIQNEQKEKPLLKQKVEKQIEAIQSVTEKQEKPLGKQNLIQHNKRMAELDKIKADLQFLSRVVLQDYNQFASKSYKEKFILISTLYNNLTNGSVNIHEIQIESSTFVQFFQFQNTKGLSYSMKILKIYMMLYESNTPKLIQMYQSSIKEILMLAIKNANISSFLQYQVVALIQMVYELKVFNSELFAAIFSSLSSQNLLAQLNTLKILLNFIMRNNNGQLAQQLDQILYLIGQKVSSSSKPQIRFYSLQILIQIQLIIGDKVNSYIGSFRMCQLRKFKQETQQKTPNTDQLNPKEKSKCDEIETMICQETIKKEVSLIRLIKNEIEFYSKNEKNEFSLNYLKIFSTLLKKSNKNVVRNTLKLLTHTHTLFKPSQILKLFDIIINISPSIDQNLYRIVLIMIIEHQGFALFYHKFIENLAQEKYAESLVYILRYTVNVIQNTMISEIVELVLKFIDEKNITLNNLIYHFLALASIKLGSNQVEDTIKDNYFMPDHLLKKVKKEKEKCFYLMKLKNIKQQNIIDNQANFILVDKGINFDQISEIFKQNMDLQISDMNDCKILEETQESKDDCYSFVEKDEDEI